MRPCSWTGSALIIPLLLLLLLELLHTSLALERHYHIAAVNIHWNYDGHRSGPTFKKVVYREYDAGFKQAKTHPAWLGLLGPTLRGQEGDVIVVTFRNMADTWCGTPCKQSEGGRPSPPRTGAHLLLGADPEVTPSEDDPPCLTYTYISHYDMVRDYNSGLIGAMLVCKAGSLDDAGEQLLFSREYVLLFGVFNETKSWYPPRLPNETHHQRIRQRQHT
ncbi:hypothetical protein AAFF_G00259440 [Aldrovandia affinis]|uniref:Endonuclease/exonuclease/phosphatase domain-containing protein n=1 Tax=Aldrovandia affinis TaxID=143900 RepID=A0AAD7RC39_9TELE|nr:hypothetical protein AAFF_G00259440 [Aldrovandia affinis]